MSRRGALSGLSWASVGAAAFTGGLGLTTHPNPALARGGPASKEELDRLVEGYTRLNYLLDNFDRETTLCNPECKRNPDVVRSYLGLRSTKDPLFQVRAARRGAL